MKYYYKFDEIKCEITDEIKFGSCAQGLFLTFSDIPSRGFTESPMTAKRTFVSKLQPVTGPDFPTSSTKHITGPLPPQSRKHGETVLLTALQRGNWSNP